MQSAHAKRTGSRNGWTIGNLQREIATVVPGEGALAIKARSTSAAQPSKRVSEDVEDSCATTELFIRISSPSQIGARAQFGKAVGWL